MRRASPCRHPLAVLRRYLGLGQQEFADRVGCSRPTIQAIELNRLKLSKNLAKTISEKTRVSAQWLLGGDPNAPIADIAGQPYSIRWSTETPSAIPIVLLNFYGQLRSILENAHKTRDQAGYLEAVQEVQRAISPLRSSIGLDPEQRASFIPGVVFAHTVNAIRSDVAAYDENREQYAREMESMKMFWKNWEETGPFIGQIPLSAETEEEPPIQPARTPKKRQRSGTARGVE